MAGQTTPPDPPLLRGGNVFWLGLLIASAVLVWIIWSTEIPLGVSGEWTWSRPALEGGWGWAFVVPLVIAAGYIAVVQIGVRRLDRCSSVQRAGWLAGLAIAGFTWLWFVQESAPEPFQLSKAPLVLYFPSSSGYFTEARANKQPLGDYLAGYEERIASLSQQSRDGDETAKRELLHIGSHPPGLIVAYRALIALCESSPAVTDAILGTQPNSVREAFAVLFEPPRPPLPPVDRAVLWLAFLCVQSIAVLTVCPLYRFLRRDCSPRAAFVAAAFWPAVPALAIFLPKSDALYPYFGMLFLWLWRDGLEGQSQAKCIAAGFVLWLGLCFSLALLPVALLAAILTCVGGRGSRRAAVDVESARQEPRPPGKWFALRSVGCGVSGFLIPCLLLWVGAGLNLFAVWKWNYVNHAAFYEHYPRTYWKWLLVNPLELAIAAGLPLAMLAVWTAASEVRLLWSSRASAGAMIAVWLLLLLSGKTMGEAARLWLVLMPWLACLAAPACEDERSHRGIVVLACQLLLTTALVTRVVGFHVPQIN